MAMRSVEYLQTVRPTQILLPTRIVRRLMRRTLQSRSHPKRLLPHFPHPLLVFMPQDRKLSLPPRKSVHIASLKRVASLSSSLNPSKKSCPPINGHPRWISGSMRIILFFMRLECLPRRRDEIPSQMILKIVRSQCQSCVLHDTRISYIVWRRITTPI